MSSEFDVGTYDVIVIGGGVAGLMAAGSASTHGAKTLILEKMPRPANKLRITGKGRCNLSNTAPLPEFISHFGSNGPFLRQVFFRFFSTELIAFFKGLGIETVIERGGRIFPASGKAEDVAEALVNWEKGCGGTLRVSSPVRGLLIENGRVAGVQTGPATSRASTAIKGKAPAKTYRAKSVIIATGGASYPATGSTGDGHMLAESVGHTIVPIRPALVPIETDGNTAGRLNGLTLRNVTVTVWINDKKTQSAFGEMKFTEFGMSGPVILSLSGGIVDAICAGNRVVLSIDLKPALELRQVDARLLRELDRHGKKHLYTVLKALLPKRLIPVCTDMTGIPSDKIAHQVTARNRKCLRQWLKDFRLNIIGYRPFTEAIITAGGVHLKEVDPRTLASRLVEGLYFAGEILDLAADTGGFNLQSAFSTGWIAGLSAATDLRM